MVVLCHPGLYRPYEGQDSQGPPRCPPRLEPVFLLNPSHNSPPTRARWQRESNLDWLGRANEPYQLSQALVGEELFLIFKKNYFSSSGLDV